MSRAAGFKSLESMSRRRGEISRPVNTTGPRGRVELALTDGRRRGKVKERESTGGGQEKGRMIFHSSLSLSAGSCMHASLKRREMCEEEAVMTH